MTRAKTDCFPNWEDLGDFRGCEAEESKGSKVPKSCLLGNLRIAFFFVSIAV